MGKDSLGFSFVNTSSAQYDDFMGAAHTLNTWVGAAVLGLNTTGLAALQLSWQARMLSGQTYDAAAQNRIYALEMQYRVGTSGAYTLLPGQRFVAGDSVAAAYPATGTRQAFTVALPAAALGQPAVEVRWIYHARGGANGQRPELGVDEIRAAATLLTTTSLTTATRRLALCVAPNPVPLSQPAAVTFSLSEPLAAGAATLFDALGRRVADLNATAPLAPGAHTLALPTQLTAGTYYLRVGGAGVPVVVQ